MAKSQFKMDSKTNLLEVMNSIDRMLSKSGKSTNSILHFFSDKLNSNLKMKKLTGLEDNLIMFNKRSKHSFDFKTVNPNSTNAKCFSPCFHSISRTQLEEKDKSSRIKVDQGNLSQKYYILQ